MSPLRLTRRLLLCILLAAGLLRAADTPDVRIRAAFDSRETVLVGQRLTLAVTLLAVGYYDGPTTFDLPSVSGLLILPPGGHALVGNETIDGVSYTTQRYELSLIARRAGDFTLPALTVHYSVKGEPLAKQGVPGEIKTDALTFKAATPPGAEKIGQLISARGLTAEEKWTPTPTASAHTGDAFVRTITFRADDVPGMAFPPFVAGKIPGLGIYPKPPQVTDREDRGTLTGTRVETIGYVCEQPGRIVIPAARFTWWDLEAKALRTVDFPAHAIDIALDPASARQLAVARRHARIESVLPWLGGAVSALAFGWFAMRLGAGACLRRAIRRIRSAFRSVPLSPLNPL